MKQTDEYEQYNCLSEALKNADPNKLIDMKGEPLTKEMLIALWVRTAWGLDGEAE